MTFFEWQYLSLQFFLLPLQSRMRSELQTLALQHLSAANDRPLILDVGGRKSPSTVGVPGDVVISDLPRASAIQNQLGLGINDGIIAQVQQRRSNIKQIVYDDMATSQLPDNTYDLVMAMEVLEHVEADASFVANVHRVLKPGGVFLMSTPNGDYLPKPNPDHKRHYRREQLAELLQKTFARVEVEYAICGGRFRAWGLRPWSVRHPWQTLSSMFGNAVNAWQSNYPEVKTQAQGTHHLIARATKSQ